MKDKSKALASFILGLFFWVPLVNIPLSIASIVFGVWALREMKQQPERYTGAGYAIVGISLSSIAIILAIIYLGLLLTGKVTL